MENIAWPPGARKSRMLDLVKECQDLASYWRSPLRRNRDYSYPDAFLEARAVEADRLKIVFQTFAQEPEKGKRLSH